jgi:hypothetical protein
MERGVMERNIMLRVVDRRVRCCSCCCCWGVHGTQGYSIGGGGVLFVVGWGALIRMWCLVWVCASCCAYDVCVCRIGVGSLRVYLLYIYLPTYLPIQLRLVGKLKKNANYL